MTTLDDDPLAPNVKPGDRIELVSMLNDPDPIPTGTTGTVVRVGRSIEPGHYQIGVDWDIDRSLHLEVPPDRFRVIERQQPGGST